MSTKILFQHIHCRNTIYPKSTIKRFNVPDNLISWNIAYPDYSPIFYESPAIRGKPWADLELCDKIFQPKWNQLDGNVNRKSYVEEYQINNEHPINPYGRTGIIGRGILGRWGPNHAADPIVTRWKIDEFGEHCRNTITKKKILQMCAIERHDCGEYAIPGGMVDPGEQISTTLKREFLEEAASTANVEQQQILTEFFQNSGCEIYKGYVDDPRNTDNAWMETVAVNFHDETGGFIGKINLVAGDDAVNVKWIDIDLNLKLYASHKQIIENVVNRLDANW